MTPVTSHSIQNDSYMATESHFNMPARKLEIAAATLIIVALAALVAIGAFSRKDELPEIISALITCAVSIGLFLIARIHDKIDQERARTNESELQEKLFRLKAELTEESAISLKAKTERFERMKAFSQRLIRCHRAFSSLLQRSKNLELEQLMSELSEALEARTRLGESADSLYVLAHVPKEDVDRFAEFNRTLVEIILALKTPDEIGSGDSDSWEYQVTRLSRELTVHFEQIRERLREAP